MKDVMAIINLNEIEDKIKELTQNRPIAGIPFAGRYRIIDFMLSNLVRCGVEMISIFTMDKYRSLVDHIGSGKAWDLDRKRDGLKMLHPMLDSKNLSGVYGDIDNFRNNLDFIKNLRQEYVLLVRSYMIADVDFRAAVEFHKNSGKDITIISKKITDGQQATNLLGMDVLNVENDLVRSIGKNLGNQNEFLLSMDMYVMSKSVLINMITSAIEKGDTDHFKLYLHRRMNNYKINTYKYDGYLSIINSTINYYRATMQLLDRSVYQVLFRNNILTKTKDEPSVLYSQTANVRNSIIANGCIVDGTVENSVLFRGVKVKKGAVVRNSILFQGTTVSKNANLNFVITDKNTRITENKILMGDSGVPFIVQKNQVV